MVADKSMDLADWPGGPEGSEVSLCFKGVLDYATGQFRRGPNLEALAKQSPPSPVHTHCSGRRARPPLLNDVAWRVAAAPLNRPTCPSASRLTLPQSTTALRKPAMKLSNTWHYSIRKTSHFALQRARKRPYAAPSPPHGPCVPCLTGDFGRAAGVQLLLLLQVRLQPVQIV